MLVGDDALKGCGVRSRLGRHGSSAQRGLGGKHARQLEGLLCKPGPRQEGPTPERTRGMQGHWSHNKWDYMLESAEESTSNSD